MIATRNTTSQTDNVKPNDLFEAKLDEDCYKKDDLMTEEDTDEDDFPGVTESMDKKTEYPPYHPYSTNDISYHPTSTIFEDKEIQKQQQGYLNTTNSNVENILEDNHYERKSSFTRRPSQLQQEMASLNALCPPSHVLKARRLSKNTIKTSVSTPVTPTRNRKPSIVDNYSKEFSSNSAVSPRFMALRKLSEVTTLPSHSVSYSSVPPVPQVPSTYTADSKDVTQESSSSKGGFDLENRVLARIDDIIETQLQFHLGQIVWRASESHLDARRFWEEQKKEMFGFAATLVDRMETQVDMQRRMALDSITSPEEKDATQRSAEESDAIMEILQKELKMYKSKYTEAQSQLFELEMLKTRNSELEKQHEIDTISLRKQWEDKDSTLKQLKKLEQERILNGTINSSKKKEPAGSQHTKMFNLETQNKQLKVQVKQMQEINRQLLEEANAYELNIKKQSKELKQIKNQLAEAELVILNNKRKMVPTSSTVTTTTVDGIDCSEDFGKKQQRTKKKDTWADIMESEDEAKKSAKEWAQKYRELQASYFEVCLKLEKKEESSESENKINELNQTIATKNEEIRHLKQAENVNRIQIDYLQLELDKYQRKNKPGMDESKLKNRYMRKNQLPSTKKPMVHQRPSPPPPPQQQRQQVNTKETCYETEDGYLTFTTEINGQLSKYAIKIPSGYQQNSPVVEQKKPAKTKFNPNAQPWPSQSNTSK